MEIGDLIRGLGWGLPMRPSVGLGRIQEGSVGHE